MLQLALTPFRRGREREGGRVSATEASTAAAGLPLAPSATARRGANSGGARSGKQGQLRRAEPRVSVSVAAAPQSAHRSRVCCQGLAAVMKIGQGWDQAET